MKKLLHIERIKILNYRPFQILIGLYFLAIILGLVIYPLIDKQIPMISLKDLFRFPDVWPFLTWVTEPYNITLGLIIIMIVTNEFSNHTFKTQIIFGLSRKEALIQKFILIFLLATFATILVGVTCILLGLTHSYKLTFKIAIENMWMLGPYFLSSIFLMSIALLFGLTIKNTALSMLGYLGTRTFLSPLMFLLFREREIRWYFPLRANTRMTPLPNLMEIFQRKMESPQPIDEATIEILPKGLPLWANIGLTLGFLTIVILLAFRIMSRKRLT